MPQKPKPTVQILPFTGKKPKRSHPPKASPTPAPKRPLLDSSGPPADRNAGDGDNQRAVLYETFGTRLRIDDAHGYMLDGSPIKYPELMRIAKQIRKRNGMPLDAKYWSLW